MFTVKGKYERKKASITWEDGLVYGNPELTRAVLLRNEESDREGPIGGPYTTSKHLSNPLSSLTMILSVMDSWNSTSGDVPVVPRLVKLEESTELPVLY